MEEAIQTLGKKLKVEFDKKLIEKINKNNVVLKSEYDLKLNDLTKRIEALEKQVNLIAWNLVESKNLVKAQEQIDIINTVTKENKEREIKDKNVMIFGVKESLKIDLADKKKDDLDAIEKLACHVSLSNDNIVKLFRIKSKKGIAPIIIEMKNDEVRKEFIKRSNRKFTNIYIYPDLTESQRNLDKQLRDKCKNMNAPLKL